MPGQRRAAEDRWRDLTWDDLEAWAGVRSLERGRSYQRTGHVSGLARTDDGRLVAWVRGTERYATAVARSGAGDEAGLSSLCTCPVGVSCKHAVAVVVDYLDALKNDRPVPTVPASDPRLRLLEQEGGADELDEQGSGEDGDEDWDEEPVGPVRRGRPAREAAATGKGDVRAYLEGLPAAELVAYVLDLARRDPEVQRDLKARGTLARGEVGVLIREARREIRRLTAEPAWVNGWTGEGDVPDYGGLKQLFERLLALGQADALLELGELLLEEGNQQVGESHDEGETATEVADCLGVVFRAVPASSRTDAQKLLYAIDMALRDEYDLCGGADEVLGREWPPAVWSEVADELARRLADVPEPHGDDFHERYLRNRLSESLIRALEGAGRDDEVIPLMEAEAPLTGSYDRLVAALLARRRRDEARRWAVEGIARVGGQWPGIASALRERLRTMVRAEKDWPTLAAMRAEEFFGAPSLHTLAELGAAAKKAGCQKAVRAAALHFLETGGRPAPACPPSAKARRRASRGRAAGTPWPLPAAPPELRLPREREGGRRDGPYYDVLLELALKEKRPDDVLRWYDAWRAGHREGNLRYGDEYERRVADAVARAHPDRAAEVYRQVIARCVARTSPSAYEEALPYLRKLRDLLTRTGHAADWGRYLAELRETEHRKRRLMEVLDRLERRPIVDG